MVHKFPSTDGYIALDVGSGAIHAVDRVVYDILDFYDGGGAELSGDASERLSRVHPAEDIAEAFREIRELERQGLLFTPDDGLSYSNAELPVVKALCLLVSQDCNLRCGYCFAGEGEYGAKGLMSLETGKAAVDFLIKSSGGRRNLEIDFFGGEPLMNFDVVQGVVAYARSLEETHNKRFRFTVTTNGLLLDDETIDYINENMHNVVLSLDGRKEVNDRSRKRLGGQGSYDAVVPKLQKLVEHRRKQNKHSSYYVRGTFTRHNLDFAKDALHLREMGFDQISVEPVVAPETADYAINENHLPRILAEYDILADVVRKAKSGPRSFNFFHFMIDLEGGPCAKKRVSGCGAGTEYAAVAADGTLYPCHQFAGLPDKDRFKMGSVQEGLTNPDIPRLFKSTGILTQDDCKACFARYFCGGGCAANAYAANGDIHKPYKLGCAMQRKRTELAIALNIEDDVK